MISLKKILFPVDFSERCQAAAPYVAELANQLRARLDLLHVVESGSHAAERRRQSAVALAAFTGHIPHGMYCPQTVALGDPADAISRYAKTHNIDLIVLPSGERHPERRAGASVTSKVLRDTSCAVWTGSSVALPQADRGPVLCAVDLEHANKQVLSYAAALAGNFRSKLIVVGAVPARTAAASAGAAIGGSRRDFVFGISTSDVQYELDELLRVMNISAEATIEVATPGEAIGRAAERTGAALLVVGLESRAGDTGDVHELVRRFPGPIVFCPPRPAPAACYWTEWQQDSDTQEENSAVALVSGLSH